MMRREVSDEDCGADGAVQQDDTAAARLISLLIMHKNNTKIIHGGIEI